MFTVITDHVQQAQKRLISQYFGIRSIEGTVEALVNPIQDIEYMLNDLNTQRTLDASIGVQLDNLAGIVAITRFGGESDDHLRLRVKAQILVNMSQGQPEIIISAFKLLTGAQLVLLDELYPAAVLLESEYIFPDQATVDQIIGILQDVVAGGVRVDGIVTFDAVSPFAMDGNLPGAGFGDLNDITAGGLFATLNLFDGEFAFDGDDPAGLGFGAIADPLVGGEFVSL